MGAVTDDERLAAAEYRAARAQAILVKVNAPLGKLRQGMTYEEVVQVLRERQKLIDEDAVLQRMRWSWSPPQHRLTIAHGAQSVLGVSAICFLMVFVDDRLERVLPLAALFEAPGVTLAQGQVAAARAMAPHALLVPAISMADLPREATNGALSSVRRALGPPEFPPWVALALAPLAIATEIRADRDQKKEREIMDQFNAVGIGLGTEVAVLFARFGPPNMSDLNARGEQVLTFTSPAPPGSSIVTDVQVDVLEGKVRALYSGQRYVRESGER